MIKFRGNFFGICFQDNTPGGRRGDTIYRNHGTVALPISSIRVGYGGNCLSLDGKALTIDNLRLSTLVAIVTIRPLLFQLAMDCLKPMK